MGSKTASYRDDYNSLKKNKETKNATLTILNGCFAGLEICLNKAKTLLGRDIGCDICLDDSHVSDEHAVIRKTNDGFTIEDLNSRCGITLNGKEVHQKTLRNGDTIVIGGFSIKFSQKKIKTN